MSKLVRVTDEAKDKLKDLVKTANADKKDHEPKHTTEQYLSSLIIKEWTHKS